MIMSEELIFVIPDESEFEDWQPRATYFRIWSSKYNKALRVYCNLGKTYVKYPDEGWRRIRSSVEYKSDGFETVIQLVLPITKDE